MGICLGFDTSNYTTSVAATEGSLVVSERKILDVKEGQRGLRQSDALFVHVKALPELYSRLMEKINPERVSAVGVSTKPRNVEGSYMPVFPAGEGYARVVADTLGVPLMEFSHQDGHIMAGILSGRCEDLLEREFLSVHLSGGTTEVLKSRYNGYGFENEIVGGTKDISAGQLIDRIGVKLGLKFPCGRELEKMAVGAEGILKSKISVTDGYVNFSGAETAILKLAEENPPKEIAYTVLCNVGQALCKMLNNTVAKTGLRDILIVGGVASNTIIRKMLTTNVCADIYFATPEYSTDNAVGIAALAEKGS